MSNPVLANPRPFPSALPVTAPFFDIVHHKNILADFQNDWARHLEWTVDTKKHRSRAFVGAKVPIDANSSVDFYRTNRFDIFSHYVRAFDNTQTLPLTNVNQITHTVGRNLVALLDQHISDTEALVVASLMKKGAFDHLTEAQKAFLKVEQAAEYNIISGDKPLDIYARTLLKLKLIARSSGAEGAAKNNFSHNVAGLLSLAKRFDPVADVINNGVKIITIYANVYAAIKAGKMPANNASITAFNQANYDAFGKAVGASEFFKDHKAEGLATLAKAGLTTSGNAAQDIWNTHLVEVALLIDAETNLDVAFLKGQATPQNPGSFGANVNAAAADALAHAPLLGALTAFTLGVPPSGKALAYPGL